jgi:ubiquinone/menaquinone biosynthesis C-methylase UbiE
LPFDNASVEEVIATHFLEHLDPDEVLNLLAEVYRVLVPGGTLLIGVPVGNTGTIEHKSFYTDRSFDNIYRADAWDYFGQRFRWELVSRSVEQDGPDWYEGTLVVTLRAVK